MAETNESSESSGGEKTEQPFSASNGDNVQTNCVTGEIDGDVRMWSMFCHLAGIAGLLPVMPVIGSIIAPLVIWQIKKDGSEFLDRHGKEAVNFQISILIYALVAGLLCFACIGFVLLPAVYIFDLVFLLIAAIKANNGEHYRYPLTIRFVK
ncbi:MAG: DUF4870 domain-containing protein [Planctomycetota bacterium]|jgi:uncharacterized Tic20 family protein